jgi:predicted Fe-Mo cluster-binding NifX family protein
MKICFPTQDSAGFSAVLFGHFGSAPFFTIVNSETDELETISNRNEHHQHGNCTPMQSLQGKNIEAVICRGMGRRAVQALKDAGITVFIGEGRTVEHSLQKFRDNQLKALTVEDACQGHGHHGQGH